MKHIKIIIDGKEIFAEENQTVLNAALDAGIYIPHLCAHPDLPSAGQCRMCVVEIDGVDEVQPSCETVCKEGMRVTTQSKKINRLRNVALELMLAGHPHDCTSCKVYLKCELQALMQYQGVVHARMRTVERKTASIISRDPLIIREPERCIACGRCIRACRDLRGVGVLDYHRMDDEIYVGTKDHLPLEGTDCRFCGACVEVCPTGALQDVEGVFQTDIPKAQALVPCQASCPGHTDIPRYISLVHEGQYSEAVAVIREKLPFPLSLGYICNHVCETGCKRGKMDQPLAIRAIKRLAVEQDKQRTWKEKALAPMAPESGKSVAVVGSGPAGMTAAYYLARKGHKVTVFERLDKPGGMLTACIPEHHLPESVALEEIDFLTQAGIDLKLNHEVVHVRTLKMEYDAVLVATGAWQGRKLRNIPGADAKNTFSALDFLQAAKRGEALGIGETAIVIGGGNVALDCARTLVRMDKTVNVVCLETREAMPADEEEIIAALEEGVNIYDNKASVAIETNNGTVAGLNVMDVEKFYFDENKKAVIETRKGSEKCIDGDAVVFAAGQGSHLISGFGLKLNAYSYPVYNEETMQTSVDGVFAAGDAITGTRFVIDAIASARRATEQIDRYLGGDGCIDETLTEHKPLKANIGIVPHFAKLERKAGEKESLDAATGVEEKLALFEVRLEVRYQQGEDLDVIYGGKSMKCEHNANMIPDENTVSNWKLTECPVELTYEIIQTAAANLCGESVMCRDGIVQLLAIVGDILNGEGQSEDIPLLQDIAQAMILSDDCEIAIKTAKLLIKALELHAEDWRSHIITKRCRMKRMSINRLTAIKTVAENGETVIDADVVIIGGGMSGLTASVAAAEKGARVVVLEKGNTVGGAANMGMGFFAVESKYQNAQMIDHTVDGLFKEFMEYTHWRVNAPLVKKLFRQSASTIEWIEQMGVEFLGAYKYFRDSNQTWHIVKTPGSNKPAERCASVMIKAMKQYADDLGVTFEFFTPAKEILADETGAVATVLATDENGKTVTVNARAVIVSSGGFGDNPEMIQQRMGLVWAKDLYSFRIPGLKGDGIKMVEKVGGAIDPSIIEVTYTTPGVTDVFKTISETMRQPNLMVNLLGKRIIDETIMNNTTFTGNAIARQPQRKAFTIITDSILDEYRAQGKLDYVTVHHNIQNVNNWEQDVQAYFAGGESNTEGLKELQVAMSEDKQFFMADSLLELCEMTGIDYDGLKQTIKDYNAMAGRYDKGFNKHPKYMREIKDGGRYYAAAHYICGYGTLAGIRTDDELRVVGEDWREIPQLFGCGTDVCSIFGDSYNFYMPGSTMGFAINSGRLAGMNAAKSVTGK